MDMPAANNASPLVVALTGGIASGKTALSERFAALGVPVADADIAARAVVEPGTPALAEIVAHFGDGVLGADGRLDRRALRERVFADSAARKRLEAIVHPRVREWLRDKVAGWRTPYGILSVPLLAENAGTYRWVDRVLVVDVPEHAQIERLMRRDDVDRKLADAMLAAQATRAQRQAIADDVHDSTGPMTALEARVIDLHAHYLALAQAKREGRLSPSRIRSIST